MKQVVRKISLILTPALAREELQEAEAFSVLDWTLMLTSHVPKLGRMLSVKCLILLHLSICCCRVPQDLIELCTPPETLGQVETCVAQLDESQHIARDVLRQLKPFR